MYARACVRVCMCVRACVTKLLSTNCCHVFLHPQVHSIVSRLIAEDGLPASHDQPTGTIVVHHVEPTRLQASPHTAHLCAELGSSVMLWSRAR